MTNTEALRQYDGAGRYCRAITTIKIPRVFEADPAAVEHMREIWQREIDKTTAAMRQAEQAVDQLPRQEWREVIKNRMLLGFDIYTTAEIMAYSIRSVCRYEQQALEYLETGEEPARPGRPPAAP